MLTLDSSIKTEEFIKHSVGIVTIILENEPMPFLVNNFDLPICIFGLFQP
jgi:hypothetical protein